MSKILLIVSIVMILGSAVLGFMTKGKITGLHGEIDSQKGTIGSLQASLTKAKDEKEAAELAATEAKEAAEQAETAMNQAKDELAKAQTDLQAANTLVQEKEAEIAKLTAAADKAPDGGPVVGDNAELLAAQQQLADAQAQLAEAQQINESLQTKVADAETQMVELREKAERRDRQQLAAGLQGQILAVNRNWNFVVLSIGDRQGAVVGGEMLVVRGNTQIAKVRITAVEPSTSIADVVAGSVGRGVVVQPGDTVIYPGSRQ
jgi:multidrug efflux pump subunit AcrA (membrane-fusion protein)